MTKEEFTPDGDYEQRTYTIELDDAAERDFAKLSQRAKSQVTKLIDSLSVSPRAGNVRELVGYKGIYRKRTGDYRVVYTIGEGILKVIIVAIGSRKNIYSTMKRRIK